SLPPCKRFRDSISPEDSVEEDINTDVLADIEADATAIEDEVEDEDEVESSDRGTMEVGVDMVAKIDIPNGMLMPDVVERLYQVEEVVQDIYGHFLEILLQRVEDNETGQRQLEALATYEANHAAELAVESQSQNGDDDENENVGGNGNRNGEGNGNRNCGGNGNENIGGNRNGNPNRNDRGVMPVTHECTYHDLMKCQPLNFKGTKGVFRDFEELTMMCTMMVPEEEDRVEKFIGGLPDNI
nr:hypothetical protein [Tanacetum cinerariifolium]